MAEMGPVTIGCPGCGERLDVPCKPIYENTREQNVLVRMDYSKAREHFRACANRAKAPPQISAQTPPAELAGRIHRMLDLRAYIAVGGSRACTMCGSKLTDCLTETGQTRVGCCAACTEGDTHPAPKGTMGCAEWAAEHGAQQ